MKREYLTPLEREEQRLSDQLEHDEISQQEYRHAMRELLQDYRDAAEEAAQVAYEREKERW